MASGANAHPLRGVAFAESEKEPKARSAREVIGAHLRAYALYV